MRLRSDWLLQGDRSKLDDVIEATWWDLAGDGCAMLVAALAPLVLRSLRGHLQEAEADSEMLDA